MYQFLKSELLLFLIQKIILKTMILKKLEEIHFLETCYKFESKQYNTNQIKRFRKFCSNYWKNDIKSWKSKIVDFKQQLSSNLILFEKSDDELKYNFFKERLGRIDPKQNDIPIISFEILKNPMNVLTVDKTNLNREVDEININEEEKELFDVAVKENAGFQIDDNDEVSDSEFFEEKNLKIPIRKKLSIHFEKEKDMINSDETILIDYDTWQSLVFDEKTQKFIKKSAMDVFRDEFLKKFSCLINVRDSKISKKKYYNLL